MGQGSNQQQTTLKDFLDENHNLLTAIGIFVALTIFAANFPVKIIGWGLSFLFLTQALFLFVEFWMRAEEGKGVPIWTRRGMFSYLLMIIVALLTH